MELELKWKLELELEREMEFAGQREVAVVLSLFLAFLLRSGLEILKLAVRIQNDFKPSQNESLLFTAPIHRNDNRQLRPLYNNDCPRIVLLWLMNALSLVARLWQFEFDSPCPLNLTIVILQLDVALALQRRVPSPFFSPPLLSIHTQNSLNQATIP